MMDDAARDAALCEIEKLRVELIDKVNTNMDALIGRLIDSEAVENPHQEYLYPLGAASSLLKGTKPAAVIFGGERVDAFTWKNVYTEILRRCSADEKAGGALMGLRNRIGSRKRVILSDVPGGMNKPVMIAGELYAESYFDTEWLMRMLVQILDAARYDYSGIAIAVGAERR